MQVHASALRVRFYASSAFTALVVLLLYVGALVAVSIVVAYVTGDFWHQRGAALVRPSFALGGPMALQGTFADGTARLWTNDPAANAWLARHRPAMAAPAVVATRVDEHDGDGIADAFVLVAKFPTDHRRNAARRWLWVVEITAVARPRTDVRVRGAAVVDVSVDPTQPTTGVRAIGIVSLRTTEDLAVSPWVSYANGAYDISYFRNLTRGGIDESSLISIAQKYQEANLSIAVKDLAVVQGDVYELLPGVVDETSLDFTTLTIILEVRSQRLPYAAPWYEAFKFAWIQVLAIAIPLRWCLLRVKSGVVKVGLVTTVPIWDRQPPLR